MTIGNRTFTRHVYGFGNSPRTLPEQLREAADWLETLPGPLLNVTVEVMRDNNDRPELTVAWMEPG